MIPRSVSDSFIRPFRERHPNLVTRKASRLEVDRMVEANPTTINIYFNMLEKYFELHHYEPSVIANFDETMIAEGAKAWKVLVPRNMTCPQVPKVDGLPHITLGVMIFADGTHADPMLIYPSTTLPSEIDEDFLHRNMKFGICGQARGWMTRELFREFCDKTGDSRVPEEVGGRSTWIASFGRSPEQSRP